MELSFTKKHDLKILQTEYQKKIWCLVRQKYYHFTAEEWVRQHWLMYLTKDLEYPRNSIVLEKEILWNKQPKRADIVVYKNQSPYILVECKAPHISLSEKDIDQLSKYNHFLESKFLVLSNGLQHYFLEKKEEKYEQINSLPNYLGSPL